MIVADKKPIEEIIEEIKVMNNVLILGCNECVTVCEAGGKKEVGILASALRMYFANQGKDMRIDERTLERQCDHEYAWPALWVRPAHPPPGRPAWRSARMRLKPLKPVACLRGRLS